MSDMWEEVALAKKENRRELVLQGKTISEKIDENGLDGNIFKLVNLNFFEVSRTTLSSIQPSVAELANLTSLVLCNNQLTEVPIEISQLSKLKLLDLSTNKIESIPEEICSLPELDTFNVSVNRLEEFPSIRDLKSLHIIRVSNNKLTSLPDGIFSENLIHLSAIYAGENRITELSSDVEDLPHLVTLDMPDNKLTLAPSQLCMCPKLKELNLKGNKFKDRRFGKMVEQECAFKSLLDYLNNILKKENQKSGKGKEKDKKKKKKGKKADDDDEVEALAKNLISVLRFPGEESGMVVVAEQGVLTVRPYIVCCIVRGLDLKANFKPFITLQTRLHDTVCQKRQAGTIATHDLKSVRMPLKYTVRPPQDLKIVPLFKQKEVSGEKLFDNLRNEAEEIRKEKKRNTFSGIHKYLDLLKDKPSYPCLLDKEAVVISFPPITNSDKTKISKDTTDILVEVTSSTSLDTCKQIMDELLYKMLEIGLGSAKGGKSGGATGGAGSASESEDEGVVFQSSANGSATKLVVEQVKVMDPDNVLKVLYPSRTDLNSGAIEVIRNFE